jgi:hypothetical protein
MQRVEVYRQIVATGWAANTVDPSGQRFVTSQSRVHYGNKLV